MADALHGLLAEGDSPILDARPVSVSGISPRLRRPCSLTYAGCGVLLGFTTPLSRVAIDVNTPPNSRRSILEPVGPVNHASRRQAVAVEPGCTVPSTTRSPMLHVRTLVYNSITTTLSSMAYDFTHKYSRFQSDTTATHVPPSPHEPPRYEALP